MHSCNCNHNHNREYHGHNCCNHAHEHSCCGGEPNSNDNNRIVIRIIISTALLIISLGLQHGLNAQLWLYLPLLAASIIIIGYDVFAKALMGIIKGRLMDECFLMSLAAICGFVLGEYAEAVAVILLYQVGEYLCDRAVGKSKSAIAALSKLKPDRVTVLRNGVATVLSPATVQAGEIILVKSGERIPLDGVIIEGEASIDTSALTGESVLRGVSVGDSVLSGCVNIDGLLKIKTSGGYSESTFARVLELMQQQQSQKSSAERFITRFARLYTPIIVSLAVLLAIIPPIILHQGFDAWLHTGMIFLVISCPCALVISIPLSFFCGIGGASKSGILFKSSTAIEVLSRCKTIAFDKTGTMTNGYFNVMAVQSVAMDEAELLHLCAVAEAQSTHPLARAVVDAYKGDIENDSIESYRELAGKGITAIVNGNNLAIGNARLMEQLGISVESSSDICLHIAINGSYGGSIALQDSLKDGSIETVAALKGRGLDCVMLSGDTNAVASTVAERLGISNFRAELLPIDKVNAVKQLQDKGTVAFVGDGINDAPVLVSADVGIAMGGIGSDCAIEGADIVIMDDSISKVATANELAKKCMRIVKENIALALLIKLAVMTLSIFGFMITWVALIADVGVCLLAVGNSLRCLTVSKHKA